MGKRKRMFGMSDRVVVFQPHDLGEIFMKMNLEVPDISKSLDMKVGTFRKYINGSTQNMSLDVLDKITQKVVALHRVRDNAPTLPKRVSLINPYQIDKEMKKRCVKVSFLIKKLEGIVSQKYIKEISNSQFRENGPMYAKYKLISDLILEQKVKGTEEQADFLKSLDEYDYENDVEILDESGNPKLNKNKMWDFYSAQEEWINRDQKKLDKLPRRGRLTTIKKNR